MPAFAELDTSALTELPAAHTAVMSLSGGGGNVFDFAEVLKIEHSGGITPGKAFVSVRNMSAADENGHITLQTAGSLSASSLKFWSRVRITCNGATVFAGSLVKRRDWIAGNAAIFE